MNTKTILPANNAGWGFWETAGHNGYDQLMTWEAASDALATAFNLKPEQVRDLLARASDANSPTTSVSSPAGR